MGKMSMMSFKDYKNKIISGYQGIENQSTEKILQEIEIGEPQEIG
jgi:hypothetical protein